MKKLVLALVVVSQFVAESRADWKQWLAWGSYGTFFAGVVCSGMSLDARDKRVYYQGRQNCAEDLQKQANQTQDAPTDGTKKDELNFQTNIEQADNKRIVYRNAAIASFGISGVLALTAYKLRS